MFQTFDEIADFSQSAERVGWLRRTLMADGLSGFVVPRADEHQGEYIPPSAARLAWLTGFTGSAGTALVLAETAAIFVDGRYRLQVREEVDLSVFEPIDSTVTSLVDHLGQAGAGLRIGIDPWLHTASEVKRLREALEAKGGELVFVGSNPIDRNWNDRPLPPKGKVSLHDLSHSGKPAAEKIAAIMDKLGEEGAHSVVLTDPSSIAWVFNIRGSDVPHTPLPLSFAILRKGDRPILFIDPDKLAPEVAESLRRLADLADPEGFEAGLRQAAGRGPVMVDPTLAAYRVSMLIEAAEGTVLERPDPARLPRAIKNAAEIEGTRAAHRRDGAAMVAFLAWLDGREPGTVTEIDAAERLEACRSAAGEADGMALKDVSFDTISGAGPNGAIIHYRVNRHTCRRLEAGDLFLLDSGAQYLDGTTDITRTVPIGIPTEDMRERFTLVLKGMIAISAARFPPGTRGVDLDPLARIALWKRGLDYAHGTGHGVGAYLSVHEGPQSISRRGMAVIEPGMILSNEPGYYREGAFGIRIENLILTTAADAIDGGDIAMLGFETLTFAPIDRRLVVAELLDREERAWLDAYHSRVRDRLTPLLDEEAGGWLARMTAPI